MCIGGIIDARWIADAVRTNIPIKGIHLLRHCIASVDGHRRPYMYCSRYVISLLTSCSSIDIYSGVLKQAGDVGAALA